MTDADACACLRSIDVLRKNLTLAITSASGFGLDEEERQLAEREAPNRDRFRR